jgi:short-subunit dehydrogenase
MNVVWITGASRGIGKAMAQKLANEGFAVALTARNASSLHKLSDSIQQQGGKVLPLPGDVSQPKVPLQIVEKILKSWQRVDTLINNAGMGIFKPILSTDVKEWDETMAVNTRSAFLCSKAVLPPMIEQRSGKIINVISVAGQQPYPNCGAYCASKYAMLGFTDVLRTETRKHGIQVTAFMPGATDTEIWGDADLPRERMMTVEQVATQAVYLCKADANIMVEQVVMRPLGGDL